LPKVSLIERPLRQIRINGQNHESHPSRYHLTRREQYATQIARDWNVRDSGAGYVTEFAVDSEFLSRYEIQQVGGQLHKELWVPAEELDEFNRHIVGPIKVIQTFT